MEATSGVDLCRVTVVAPRTRMDLALPVEAPLADLLPTLLRYAGENPEDPAFLRGGWILQRVGEDPLDASQRLGNLGLRDGDILHLRHREAGIPEFAFDDVADAIATAQREKRASWQPKDTRQTSLLISGVFFGLALLLAITAGPSWVLNGVVMLVAGAALVVGGWAMSRAVGEANVGAFLGLAGVIAAGIGGMLLLAGDDVAAFKFGAQHAAIGFAFAFVAAWNAFFGAAAAALIGGLATVAVLVFGITAPQAAAVAIAIVLALTPLLPTLSARLGRLPIPQLPLNSDELRKQTDMLPGPTVLQQAITADRMIVGLLGTTSVICGIGAIYLTADERWYGTGLAAATSIALYTRTRHFRGRAQRIWLLVGATACAVLVALNLSAGESATVLLVVGLPCLLVGAGLAAWSVSMPDRKLTPYWGRLTDVLEVLVLLTVVPLTAAMLGLFAWIMGRFA